ncbi:conserved hypothetical protein [uncultured Desulfobacterium sp.]|uniref:GmrSD restriction endonucleases N-terminal domain-containing protein n=1 Tax=uncultured Desulfobacterium sp. TaxID=201089 RepID=A0A445MXN2_9BACT|nr:conserved hypothetical protein [uncultured Desulfobacterium sp.]
MLSEVALTDKIKKKQKLDAEIADARNEIRTDKLDISYGELANLYENDELIIKPEYQRLFRWNPTQKTRFIESILLGFPTPAIFVAEDAQGVWELVDGLQRVSTVFEFMGSLKNPDGKLYPASRLVKADRKPRLPSMEDILFKNLSLKARLSIKRAGCRVEVIKTGSKPTMKYEVFERLNTGGSGLTAQEVRNCIFRATNPDFMDWIERLSAYGPFRDNLGLSEFQLNSMFDRSLILRFFTIKNAYNEFEHDVEPFITDFVREVLESKRDFDMTHEEKLFKETFKLIGRALGEDSWRHCRKGKHKGPLSVYVFEAVATGVAVNIDLIRELGTDELKDRIVEFKEAQQFVNNTGPGANIKSKMRGRIEFAHNFFAM